MRIEEGRLIERECPHCGGLERRAFGESVSDRGELASYAFGWTAEHADDDRIAHVTIGIGAGNEGGGTFHAEVHVHEGRYAMTLVDRDQSLLDVLDLEPGHSAERKRPGRRWRRRAL